MFGLKTLTFVSLLAGHALSETACGAMSPKSFTWIIRKSDDGKYITINGDWPAKPLIYNKCDLLSLTVVNTLSGTDANSDATLHFHGLLQDGFRTLEDGAQGLSQSSVLHGAPVPVQGQTAADPKTFTYNLMLDRPGTYWTHSHSPSQYPKGLRAPLIVRDQGDTSTPSIITLSDWWSDFEYAHQKTITEVSADTCGAGGTGAGYGIEFPPEKVLFNDVGGYETTPDQSKKNVVIATCGVAQRLRIVNLSSHSRFYFWFSDKRKFTIVELDGVAYTPLTTDMVELSSGQRVSIMVDGKDNNLNCKAAYIIAASDLKVSHGTAKCNMKFSRPDRAVQWAVGYLNVGNLIAPSLAQDNELIKAGADADLDKWLRVWAPATIDSNFQTYNKNIMPNSWDPSTIGWQDNRLQFTGSKYKILYSSPKLNSAGGILDKYNYGGNADGRTDQAILGLDGAGELDMQPAEALDMWKPDNDGSRQKRMHYITLKGNEKGFASMAENWQGGGIVTFTNPELAKPATFSKTSEPTWFPSVFRALRRDANVDDPQLYSADKPHPGNTIMVPASTGNSAHWLIVRSLMGDHPMHLHGHHFQVLAKLPSYWWNETYSNLYDEVVTPRYPTRSNPINKANPPRRDTIMIEKGITYVLAFQPDNPGVWAFHCHNDLHAVKGMFAQVIERPTVLRDIIGSWDTTTPAIAANLRMRYYQGTGAGVYGDNPLKYLAKAMRRNFETALRSYGWDKTGIEWEGGWADSNLAKRDDRMMRRGERAGPASEMPEAAEE